MDIYFKERETLPDYWNDRVKSSMNLFLSELDISQVKNNNLKVSKNCPKDM